MVMSEMSPPSIAYGRPTSRAFGGMRLILFQPFDIGKWFVLGFTAWLAGLLDGGGSGGGGGGGGGDDDDGVAVDFDQLRTEAWAWMQDHLELVIALGAVLVLVVPGIYVVLMWVSSRGKFMFLDNVVHNRAEVRAPWIGFQVQGDSLFLWRLGFGFCALAAVVLVLGGFAAAGFAAGGHGWVPVAVVGALVFLGLVVVLLYIATMLEDFVIPLMSRNDLRANDAWRLFIGLHRGSPASFVRYALWKLLLGIGATACIFLAGFATCCIGFLLMAIPYVGAVLLLPVSVFFRLLGPEFLRQFGSEFDLLPAGPDRAGPPWGDPLTASLSKA